MSEAALARRLLGETDLHAGLLLLAAQLRLIAPFQTLSLWLFSPAQCHVLENPDSKQIVTREVAQPAALIDWLNHHVHPGLLELALVPAALKQSIAAEFSFPLLLPIRVAGEAIGLLGIDSPTWQESQYADAEEQCAIFGLWLQQFPLRDQVAQLRARLAREVVYLRDEMKSGRDLRTLSGESAAMKAVRQAIQQVAAADSTVLIAGETGTGKELVARGIHQLSKRRDRLMVTINCAALAPNVITSELFGHEAGAFTGATKRRIGRFELAHQGTLFLDEIAEISPEVQVMLLRVLQEKTIERVGGSAPIPVDVRLIAATHADLAQAVATGCFRADLFYRLNVFPIFVPPLRERREDIPDLARHFLLHFNRRMNKRIQGIAPRALDLLLRYDWPGNVRELENLLERAMIVTDGTLLDIDPNWLHPNISRRVPSLPPRSLRDREKQDILDALDHCQGKIYGSDGAAARLGLKPTTLYGKMRKHGIGKLKNDAP